MGTQVATREMPLEVVEALAALDEAHDQLAAAAAHLATAVAESEPTRAQIIEMYWSVPEIPVAELAAKLGMRTHEAFETRAWGSVVVDSCHQCGGPVRAGTRNEARQLTARPHPICEDCGSANASARIHGNEQRLTERAAEIERLRAMPYADYLRSAHWRAIRAAALRRARWRCQLCNAAERLDVHHRTYERRGCEVAADVIVLCRGCHSTHHGVEA